MVAVPVDQTADKVALSGEGERSDDDDADDDEDDDDDDADDDDKVAIPVGKAADSD